MKNISQSMYSSPSFAPNTSILTEFQNPRHISSISCLKQIPQISTREIFTPTERGFTIRVFLKIDFSLICKCKQILSVYIPYEVNKKRIGNKSLKLMKCTKLFNIQRKSQNIQRKIWPVSVFHFCL